VGTVEIRQVQNRAELEACYDLWARVFPDGREFFQVRLDADSSYDPATTWAAWVDGELAAAVQIFPYETEVDGVRLKVGGIGNVATDPTYRRRGLAQAILRAQTRWMRTAGYDVSLLFTGIQGFYEQLGWRSRHGMRIQLDDETVTAERDSNFSAAASSHESEQVSIRPFHREDLPALMEIYEHWRKTHPGAWLRTRAYWEDAERWVKDETFVAVVNGQIGAYIRIQQHGETCDIRELCHLQDSHHLALFLYGHLLQTVGSTRNIKKLNAFLPTDHELHRYLSTRPNVWVTENLEMWKVIDAHGLIGKLQPMLSERVRGLEAGARYICLQVDDNDVYLQVNGDGVHLLDPNATVIRYEHTASLDSGEFMQWMLCGATADKSMSPLWSRLFPSRAGALWRTDYF
jgi:predicted N-acetyltransferase YhbS